MPSAPSHPRGRPRRVAAHPRESCRGARPRRAHIPGVQVGSPEAPPAQAAARGCWGATSMRSDARSGPPAARNSNCSAARAASSNSNERRASGCSWVNNGSVEVATGRRASRVAPCSSSHCPSSKMRRSICARASRSGSTCFRGMDAVSSAHAATAITVDKRPLRIPPAYAHPLGEVAHSRRFIHQQQAVDGEIGPIRAVDHLEDLVPHRPTEASRAEPHLPRRLAPAVQRAGPANESSRPTSWIAHCRARESRRVGESGPSTPTTRGLRTGSGSPTARRSMRVPGMGSRGAEGGGRVCTEKPVERLRIVCSAVHEHVRTDYGEIRIHHEFRSRSPPHPGPGPAERRGIVGPCAPEDAQHQEHRATRRTRVCLDPHARRSLPPAPSSARPVDCSWPS